MSKKYEVQLIQLAAPYRGLDYIPYAVGLLRAYAEQFPEIRDCFEFRPLLYQRDAVEAIVDRIGKVDILGLSSYVWNWRINLAIAQQMRQHYPNCLIFVGGPHVPDILGDFFFKYPFIDIACHGEGEITFYEMLKAYMGEGKYQNILGLSYRDRSTGKIIQNPKRPRIADLDVFPSPYLSGTFEHLFEDPDVNIKGGIWETNRGCPFKCSYCDWGEIGGKVNQFGIERLYQEIEWFAEHQIEMVIGSDANFGMFKRDKEIAELLVETKRQKGYPQKFAVAFTKNSDEKIYELGKIINDGELQYGITLSMQSLDSQVLKNINRSNINSKTFQKLQSRYTEEDIPTYTELIIGLPGETYDSFVNGLDTLMKQGQHNHVHIFNCQVLPNAEMGSPHYRQLHQIETVESPVFRRRSTPYENQDTTIEYEEFIVATATMSRKDWCRIYRFAWATLCFHWLGLVQLVAIFIRNRCDISYRTFYETIVNYAVANPNSALGQELIALDRILNNVLSGRGFDNYIPEFCNINWPAEEATYLRLSQCRDQMYRELKHLTNQLLSHSEIVIEKELLNDLWRYQEVRATHYEQDGDFSLDLNYNLHEYIQGCMINKPASLEEGDFVYRIVDNYHFAGNQEKFAKELGWNRWAFKPLRSVVPQQDMPINSTLIFAKA